MSRMQFHEDKLEYTQTLSLSLSLSLSTWQQV